MSTKQTPYIMTGVDHRDDGSRAIVRQAITTQAAHAIVRGVTTYDMEITASCDAKLIVVEWDDALDVPGNHAAAALQLFDMLGWNERNELVMGSTSTGFVFVQVPKQAAKS